VDRVKNMCFDIVPIYYGDRPVSTRGKPNESKDYYFRCYRSAGENDPFYRQAGTIMELCSGCKKYRYIKPLSSDEIRTKYYSGQLREVLVVSSTGWHFKTL
jgi:hypothetical protein